MWRCLAIHNRIIVGRKRPEEDTNRDALKLAREYNKQPTLKEKDVRATKLVDFEGIARVHNINIRLYEPKDESQTIWRLVYGKNQHKASLPDVNIGLYKGHCFYIKDVDLLAKHWQCRGCKQRFNKNCNFHRHEKTCTGGETRVICEGKKFEHIMNSTEKVFYGGKHGGEREVEIAAKFYRFVDGYDPIKKKQYLSIMVVNDMDVHASMIEMIMINFDIETTEKRKSYE